MQQIFVLVHWLVDVSMSKQCNKYILQLLNLIDFGSRKCEDLIFFEENILKPIDSAFEVIMQHLTHFFYCKIFPFLEAASCVTSVYNLEKYTHWETKRICKFFKIYFRVDYSFYTFLLRKSYCIHIHRKSLFSFVTIHSINFIHHDKKI